MIRRFSAGLAAPAALAALLAAAPAAAKEDFVLEDEVAVCTGCHGEAGVPVEPDYPVIWGQQYFYIFTQLRDYGAGRRQNDVMTGIAAEYDRDQAKLLAEHFAGLAWPDIPSQTEEGDAALAEKGITGGQCSACHGKWQGDSRIPRLAGQQAGYLARTMEDFKTDVRMNAPDKNSTMKQLDDATIAALSRYLSDLDIQ
ncbi:c-type cytochrome [Mangrovicoccus ximenensis]|uniref:c-type cytochrome n=1 Tax=Mangrovicoccus ximenensis TaxID=1911570 RepID=UPI000D36892C|nr:c-type cytochrome [Mangrovicoccus ximenensis]